MDEDRFWEVCNTLLRHIERNVVKCSTNDEAEAAALGAITGMGLPTSGLHHVALLKLLQEIAENDSDLHYFGHSTLASGLANACLGR